MRIALRILSTVLGSGKCAYVSPVLGSGSTTVPVSMGKTLSGTHVGNAHHTHTVILTQSSWLVRAGVYLFDTGSKLYVWLGSQVAETFFTGTLGCAAPRDQETFQALRLPDTTTHPE